MRRTDNAANFHFSQSQGNVHFVMYPGRRALLQFDFPAANQKVSNRRLNHEDGIKFTTPVFSLRLFLADPETNHRF